MNSNKHTATQRFIEAYQQLDQHRLNTLTCIYHPDIHFQDAVCQINGWPALKHYFELLYQNIEDSHFHVESQLIKGDQAFIQWTMIIRHRRLNKVITTDGISCLCFEGERVIRHRDYFDLGALVYENIPFLGRIIRRIKAGLSPQPLGDSHD